jgi:hypothetical protein
MVINDPTEFKMRKQVCRNRKHVIEWVDMRKGVAYMFRYREVSLAANGRCSFSNERKVVSSEAGRVSDVA